MCFVFAFLSGTQRTLNESKSQIESETVIKVFNEVE
jgi:hypothetical protein